MIFNYSFSELSGDCQSSNALSFDEVLMNSWNELHKKGNVFNYKLEIRDERIVDGKFGFVLQLNPERSSKRRPPDKLISLKQEFNRNGFNFNKISNQEHIMEIQEVCSKETWKDLIIINTSPICSHHSLLCPSVDECLPQEITLKSLVLIMRIMFMTNNRYLRIGFNSLCGMASVNHLHYHIIILEYKLPVETVQCVHLKGPIYAIYDSYPAKGFCFQLKSKYDIEKVAADVFLLTSYLSDKNIAHNLFAMKGKSLDDSGADVWRIFVWARENAEGVKRFDFMNVAMCEFAGHFPVKNEMEFKTPEDKLSQLLDDNTKNIFNKIVKDVSLLFS